MSRPTSNFGYFTEYLNAGLESLNNVSQATPNNGDALLYNTTSQMWYPGDPEGADVVKTDEVITLDNSITVWDGTDAKKIKDTTVTVEPVSARIQNLGAPLDSTDATTKAYVDSIVSLGLAFNEPVTVASTAAIDIATGGLLTIDGEVLVAGQRVMVKDGSTANPGTTSVDNGIYVADAGPWSRTVNEGVGQVASGRTFGVDSGVLNGGQLITVSTATANFGDAITFTRVASFGDIDGPANSTDNAITRWDGVSGQRLQDSGATLDDTGNIVTPGLVQSTGADLDDPAAPGTNKVSLRAANATTSYTLTYPAEVGQSGSYLIYGLAGQMQWRRSTAGVTAPTNADDSTLQYGVGSIWVDGPVNRAYICTDATVGAAVWFEITSVKVASAGFDPGASNDTTQGYSANSVWTNTSTDSVFICADPSAGAAVWQRVNNVKLTSASGSPGVANDDTQGYENGSLWVDTSAKNAFVCISSATGAAVWKRINNFLTNTTNTDPTVNDDGTQGYELFSRWYNTVNNTSYVLVDNATGAAKWEVDSRKDQLSGVTTPDVLKDQAAGYSLGSLWIDTVSEQAYMTTNTTNGAAVWHRITEVKDNATSGTAPSALNDVTEKYELLSKWLDEGTGRVYMNFGTSPAGNATWKELESRYVARVASTGLLTLFGNAVAIDGVACDVGDLVLVKDQTTQSQNGLYIIDAAGWPRATALPAAGAASGFEVYVREGTDNGKTNFVCTTASGSDVVGTDPLAFAPFHNPVLNNFSAIVAPGANDDASKGYSVGSVWVDIGADLSYRCVDATLAAAVWQRTSNIRDLTGGVNNPTAVNDTTQAYEPGSAWTNIDSKDVFTNLEASTGNALWKRIDSRNIANVASTGALTLSGTQTVDGIPLQTGDLCLVKDQGTGTENGLYVVDSGAWVRSSALPSGSSAFAFGVRVFYGTVNANTNFACTNPVATSTVDTHALVFAPFDNPVLNNYTATAAPVGNDDASKGYSVGSVWVDTTGDLSYTCVDSTTGAAVWSAGGGGGSGGAVTSNYLAAYASADQTVAATSNVPVALGTYTGDIAFDGTNFTLEGGKRYSVSFTPRIDQASAGVGIFFGIRETVSQTQSVPYYAHVNGGVKQAVTCRLQNASISSQALLTIANVESVQPIPNLIPVASGNTNIFTATVPGMYRVTATICGDNQGGDGGFQTELYMNNLIVATQTTDQGGVTENDRESHCLTGVNYLSGGQVVQLLLRRIGAGGGQTDIIDSRVTFELLSEGDESGGAVLNAVLEPVTTTQYQVYKVALSNSQCRLLGTGNNRSTLMINEVSYSAFNPTREFAVFSVNDYGVSGGGTGDGISSFANQVKGADHLIFDTPVGWGKKSDGASATAPVTGAILQMSNFSAGNYGNCTTGFSTGSISLDTTTAYTTTSGVASIGRVTLAANKGYRIEISASTSIANLGYHVYQLYDVTTGTPVKLGTAAGQAGGVGNGYENGAQSSLAYFKPAVQSIIEARFVAPNTNPLEIVGDAAELDNDFYRATTISIEVVESSPKETDFTGATAGADGTQGLVPAPLATYQDATLKGDASWLKNNFAGTVAPGATDDSSAGYAVGSIWVDTTGDLSYTCVDATVGAAVWSAGGGGGSALLERNFVSVLLSTNYTTDIGLGDHIKYDSVSASAGTAIVLDTAAYPALGRFTLEAGKTYRLEGSLNAVTGTGYIIYQWYDVTAAAAIGGKGGIMTSNEGGGNEVIGPAVAVFTPSVQTTVELQILTNAGIVQIGFGVLPGDQAYAYIEELSYTSFSPAPATAQFETSTAFVNGAGIPVGTRVPFDTTQFSSGSGITLNAGNGEITLQGGRTYKVMADMKFIDAGIAGALTARLYDSTNAVFFGQPQSIFSATVNAIAQPGGVAFALIKPATDIVIDFRVTVNLGGLITTIGDLSYGYASINIEALEGKPNENPFSGATAGAAGTEGLVPAPAAGEQFSTLLGNATWRNSLEAPWIFGVAKQVWSNVYGDPASNAKIPMTLSGFENTTSDPPFFSTVTQNDYFLEILGAKNSLQRVVSWDNGTSPVYWEMQVDVKVAGGTNPPADGFYMFGNDDLNLVASGPSGGVPSDSNGVLVFFDVFAGNTGDQTLRIFENGTQVFSGTMGLSIHPNDRYQTFKVTRLGSLLRVQIFPSQANSFGASLVYEHTLAGAFNTLTRWGVGGYTGGNTVFIAASRIECRTLE